MNNYTENLYFKYFVLFQKYNLETTGNLETINPESSFLYMPGQKRN